MCDDIITWNSDIIVKNYSKVLSGFVVSFISLISSFLGYCGLVLVKINMFGSVLLKGTISPKKFKYIFGHLLTSSENYTSMLMSHCIDGRAARYNT
jgi:hypothetical protein